MLTRKVKWLTGLRTGSEEQQSEKEHLAKWVSATLYAGQYGISSNITTYFDTGQLQLGQTQYVIIFLTILTVH